MNETLQTIRNRYSCRTYDGHLPQKEKLEAIALAAVQSPSAMNRQPWQIIVITNKSLIEEMDAEGMSILANADDKTTYDRFMSRGGTLFYNAPCMYLILKQPGADMDVGIVSENITLAATSLGLDSVICGMASIPFNGPKSDVFKKKVGFLDEWEFGVAVLVGNGQIKNEPHTPDTSKIHYVE